MWAIYLILFLPTIALTPIICLRLALVSQLRSFLLRNGRRWSSKNYEKHFAADEQLDESKTSVWCAWVNGTESHVTRFIRQNDHSILFSFIMLVAVIIPVWNARVAKERRIWVHQKTLFACRSFRLCVRICAVVMEVPRTKIVCSSSIYLNETGCEPGSPSAHWNNAFGFNFKKISQIVIFINLKLNLLSTEINVDFAIVAKNQLLLHLPREKVGKEKL